MARPSDYSDEMASAICEQIAEGKSLRAICREDGMPATSTVCLWLQRHSEFSEQYARARELQIDALVEEIFEIVDDGSNDWMDGKFGRVVDHEHVMRSKLRADARKWYASKVAPKKYGDRLELAGDDKSPITVRWKD